MKDYLEGIVAFIFILGAIYRLAQVEANINTKITRVETNITIAIDGLKDNLSDRLNTNVKDKIDVLPFRA